jgi:hypothetical protein
VLKPISPNGKSQPLTYRYNTYPSQKQYRYNEFKPSPPKSWTLNLSQ